MSDLRRLILDRIRDVPDYPQQGVLFKDITPLLADPYAFAAVVDEFAGLHRVDKIVGIEARGFILAAPAACKAGAGFVPVRKKGKLPSETLEASYDLEYGSATIEVHRDAFAPGDRVLIVDDVLATGGTACAAVELVRRAGAEVVAIAVLMELASLKGRERLDGVELHSLVIV
ncbi:adenine phosphoribosyltransferase [Streptosporangium sp. NBC_01639]|uniref:adenine phosphoribosyltransferase n=1 Tax=unclassified Streptosporangium TaxID=2632669 RepID=UPI002DD98427|nr:adenine phosphoribosyltransferase [Streptosporangium sp. NBC_01756]WSC87249.1 adenine phosphoribosyltransferase [Streptosporangium sp. NBC_01756]WTD54061.1 adenine phosphoribosyltransferase [Streptosporangium sp. NBC_01639]